MSDVGVEEEPTAAYWLSLVGAIIGFFLSLIILGIAASIGSSFFGVVGMWGIISSMVVMYAATSLKSDPWEHTKWGIVITVFSVIGMATILGLIGGILALVYKPEESVRSEPPAPPITRICPKCGRVLNEQVKFCPYCGNELA
jgi:hypothetical protein